MEVIGEYLSITANKRKIDELLYNFIENAIKYNKNGGKVTASFAAEVNFYKIIVADTGIGIASEHQIICLSGFIV